MPGSFDWWLDDPKGGQHPLWQRTREKLEAHDPTCDSLVDVWLPREGGVCCPSDLFWCEDCEVGFFNEVMKAWPSWEVDYYERSDLCECCWRTRKELEP